MFIDALVRAFFFRLLHQNEGKKKIKTMKLEGVVSKVMLASAAFQVPMIAMIGAGVAADTICPILPRSISTEARHFWMYMCSSLMVVELMTAKYTNDVPLLIVCSAMHVMELPLFAAAFARIPSAEGDSSAKPVRVPGLFLLGTMSCVSTMLCFYTRSIFHKKYV
jgi:hypothetical protein